MARSLVGEAILVVGESHLQSKVNTIVFIMCYTGHKVDRVIDNYKHGFFILNC